MGNPSTSTRRSKRALDYREFAEKIAELGLEFGISEEDYSSLKENVRDFISALLEALQEARGEGLNVRLTREEVEYIIYRLRTIYGDPRATSIVAKLSDVLRSS